MEYFINFTNHPSTYWGEAQINAAQQFGEIIDIEFPNISPHADEKYIIILANKFEKMILDKNPRAVLVQGEFTLSFQIVNRLISKKVKVLSACSERMTEEYKDDNNITHKISKFKFVKFREYSN